MPTLNKVFYKGNAYSSLLDMVYPIGSVFLTVSDTNPAILLGGTWVKIENALLAASGTTYGVAANNSGSNTITTAQMPQHKHSISHTHPLNGSGAKASWVDGHKHTINQQNNLVTQNDTMWPVVVDSGTKHWAWGDSRMNLGGSHDHKLEGNTAGASVADSGTSGSGNAFIPYHYSVNVWKRTA